jgi:nucleoid-associated protein YgaU
VPITRGGLEPAVIINKNTGVTVPCMFNPFEYTLAKQNQYEQAETKGRNIPHVRFRQGGSQTLRLKLLFDTYGERIDVRTITDNLWHMMMVDEDRVNQRTGKSEPPHVIFQWGRFSFEAVVTSINQKLILFLQDGTPVRTTVDISLQQVMDESLFAPQNPTSGGGVAPKTRMLYAGDRLDLIAWEEYGDSTEWRRIAEANDILDPLHLKAGRLIVVPPLE